MMPNIKLSQLAKSSHGQWQGVDKAVTAIAIDSRTITQGGLFVALAGEHVDGHKFLSAAKKNGAIGAVVEKKQDDSLDQIVVKDTRIAIAKMAQVNREIFQGKVVGITGSAGKTTCKNMLAAIFSCSSEVCATQGNLNNELGVPLTLQRLNEQHSYAVIEMGASKIGDIAYLANISHPDVALVTNVNEAHLGGFGNLKKTAQAKGEIYQSLSDGGIAVVNLDDTFSSQWIDEITNLGKNINVITFSVQNVTADICANKITVSKRGLSFSADINCLGDKKTLNMLLPLLGRHNISNALAAIAVAVSLSIDSSDIEQGVANVKAEPGRLCLHNGENQLCIIDDSYNANPQSIKAAIDVLLEFNASAQKKILVLGAMGELGDNSVQMHTQVGEYAAVKGVDHLLVVGTDVEPYINGFQSVKNMNGMTTAFDNKQAMTNYLLSDNCSAAVVLIKGSRIAKMNEVVLSLLTEKSLSKGTV